MEKEKALFFYRGPNRNNNAPGTENIIFKTEIAPNAGNSATTYNLPALFQNQDYRSWELGGYDHQTVFRKLSEVFSAEKLREEAEKIENGGKSEYNILPIDMRRLAAEIEKV